MIAAGTESMSMIPMLGRLAFNAEVFTRDENIGIAYGMGLTAEKVATQWKSVARGAGCLRARVASQGARCAGFGRVRRGDQPADGRRACARPRQRTRSPSDAAASRGTRARAPTRRPKGLRKLRPVFAAKGSVTAGNSSQTSDGAGASILVSERMLQRARPLAACALSRVRRGRRRRPTSWASARSPRSRRCSSAPASSRTNSTGSSSTRRSQRRALR